MNRDYTYDVIVVGAGIEGSATAYQLAKKGKSTLLLEQFPIPHNRGSSHGQTRITRKAYGVYKHYAVMMEEAYNSWNLLEKETNTTLYYETGMLCAGKRDNTFINGTIEFSKTNGIPVEVTDEKDVGKIYPKMTFPKNYVFVLDKCAGILLADKGLRAFQDMFRKNGGILKDNEGVTNITPGSVIIVQTSKGQYSCKSIILTVGPWAKQLLPTLGIHIPLKPIRISVCYWKEKNPGEYGLGKFPTFYESEAVDGKYSVYGFPSMEYPGYVKMCLGWGSDVDPDDRDFVNEKWVISRIKKYVYDHFPNLHSEPSIVEPCIYTMVPDEDFVLDKHPKWPNVIIGAGFSGHGFKLAPVVGKLLAELAIGETLSYDISPCRLNRFIFQSKM